MLTLKPLTPLVRFLAGVSYIPGGAKFLVSTPRIWPVALAPLLVAAILLVIGLFFGAFWAAWFQQSFFGESLRNIPVWFAFIVLTGVWIGSLAAGAIIALSIAFALLGPLFEKLSETVEELLGIHVRRSKGLKWEIIQSIKTAAYFAIAAPVAIILGFVPFIGPPMALLFTGHRVAFQNTDSVLLRRGMGFRERQAFHKRFRSETLGFGVAAVLLFPVLNVLAVPVFVVAATRLVNDLEAINAMPSDEETAAVVAVEEATVSPT